MYEITKLREGLPTRLWLALQACFVPPSRVRAIPPPCIDPAVTYFCLIYNGLDHMAMPWLPESSRLPWANNDLRGEHATSPELFMDYWTGHFKYALPEGDACNGVFPEQPWSIGPVYVYGMALRKEMRWIGMTKLRHSGDYGVVILNGFATVGGAGWNQMITFFTGFYDQKPSDIDWGTLTGTQMARYLHPSYQPYQDSKGEPYVRDSTI